MCDRHKRERTSTSQKIKMINNSIEEQEEIIMKSKITIQKNRASIEKIVSSKNNRLKFGMTSHTK